MPLQVCTEISKVVFAKQPDFASGLLSKIKVFEAGVHNIVYFFQKAEGSGNKPERREHEDEFGKVKVLPTDEQRNLTYRAFFPGDNFIGDSSVSIIALNDICYVCVGMVVNANEKMAVGAFDMNDLVVDKKDSSHPKAFVEGKHLNRWIPATNKYLEWGTKRAPSLFRRPTFPELYEVAEKYWSSAVQALTRRHVMIISIFILQKAASALSIGTILPMSETIL